MDSKNRILLLAGLVLLGVGGRFAFAGMPNFAPVGAIALFAGASFADRRIGFVLPILIMLVSDWMIGFHSSVLFVYAGMLVYAALGMLAGNRLKLARLVPATLAGSLAFFAITNFGSFLAFYPQTWAGFVECFVAAIPYFRNTLAADVLFGSMLFGGLAMVERFSPQMRPTVS